MTLSDYDGRTALHLASAEGHVECVEFLLELCNVDHNIKDRWGNTPLDEATNFGHAPVIELLQLWDERTERRKKEKENVDDPPIDLVNQLKD